MEFKIYVHKPIWLMKYTKKSIRFLMFQLNASFRGVECEMLDMYFDCTDNTAYCSLRELDSKVIISSPKFVGSSQYFFSIAWSQSVIDFKLFFDSPHFFNQLFFKQSVIYLFQVFFHRIFLNNKDFVFNLYSSCQACFLLYCNSCYHPINNCKPTGCAINILYFQQFSIND